MANTDSNSVLTPPQLLLKASDIGKAKAKLRALPLLLLSILAGMYIAFGGVFSTVAATGMMGHSPYGVIKVLQGLVFSLGLILVVVGGAELFTGNMLMVIPLASRKISLMDLLRNWGLVYAGNFLGSLMVAGLVILARIYTFSNGELGNTMFAIANTKLGYSFAQALALGILCNILVCLAVWLSYSARNTTDKVLAVLFPISAFIAAGFEHSVANMYLIPVAFMIRSFDPIFSSTISLSSSMPGWLAFLQKNLIPVTLGNIIGGVIFVALTYFYIYQNHPDVRDREQ
ncbi:MAG TPA: formate/nitrite transporter family protein [Anaerolineaceae bacterium]|nr:formate/nitrite transporter family protein [Anaerolineaceae bacterium]